MSVNSQAPLAPISEFSSTDPHYRRVTVEALPDDVLLETFSFYVDEAQDRIRWVASARARVQEVATRRVYIAASPKSATLLHREKTGAEDAGYLANAAHSHMEPC